MTDYYLLDHLNPYGPHFYTSRRNPLQAIVMHITAGLEDLDLKDDQSAERTAKYAATTSREVSWHSGSDTDTHLYLLPANYTAWHVRGYNSRTYGHEISKRDTDWRDMDPDWIEATLFQTAVCLAPVVDRYTIPLVLRSRTEINNGERGFTEHWELDPDRRTDPGLVGKVNTFPWKLFFTMLRFQLGHPAPRPVPRPRPIPSTEDYKMLPTVKIGAKGKTVRKLQGLLVAHGVLSNNGIDGDFGPNTQHATRRLQRKFDLNTDGIAGPKTWRVAIER